MATSQLRRIIRNLAHFRPQEIGAGLTDGQLLESYVRTREQEAFAALVHRLGPMVWGVCRRILGHHDAEDAFQATFLVLARKAAVLLPRETVANWLHGVARHSALKARAITVKRGTREKQVIAMPEPAVEQRKLWDDVQPLLDLELGKLPDKYRAVIILCDLEGKTRKEAARHFRMPEGTVASRLATARSMLAKRLSRHGLVTSSTALALLLTQQAASARVPLSVASATIQAAIPFAAGQAAAGVVSTRAVFLAEGVLRTMLLSKLKLTLAMVFMVTVLGGAMAAIGQERRGGNPTQAPGVEGPAEKAVQQPDPTKKAEALPTNVTGVAKAVDAGKRSLTVAHRDGETTFTVAEDADIRIDHKRGELARLPAGAQVSLSQFTDAKTVRAIQAQGAAVFGTVTAVDTEKKTITVSTGQTGEKTYLVSDDTEITIDGQGGQTLRGIPNGASLHALNLCVDQKTAYSINVQGPSLHHVPVKSVDADGLTISFSEKAHPDLAGQTYKVTKDAVIRIDGEPGKLADIPEGAFVNVVPTVYGRTARHIDAEGPQISDCGITAVNVTDGTITFDDKAPEEVAGKTLKLAKNANVLIDGQPDLSALATEARVSVILSVNRKTIRHLHAQGPSESGVVKGVNAQKSTIVIDDKTYTVAKDAGILIDSKGGKLSGLPEGAFVRLTLSMDKTKIRQIFAQGRDLQGRVKAVDAVKNTITVDGKTYPVAKDATIVLDANVSTLASLPEGAFVGVTLCVDQRTVHVVHARSP